MGEYAMRLLAHEWLYLQLNAPCEMKMVNKRHVGKPVEVLQAGDVFEGDLHRPPVSPAARGCMGAPAGSLKGEWITPIQTCPK